MEIEGLGGLTLDLAEAPAEASRELQVMGELHPSLLLALPVPPGRCHLMLQV